MLYDNKRWDKTKTDPLSLESLVAWLENKPAAGAYDYENCKGKCLYGLYMTAHGVAWKNSGACSDRDCTPEQSDFCSLVYQKVASQHPWTFGAALERAKAALAAQS